MWIVTIFFLVLQQKLLHSWMFQKVVLCTGGWLCLKSWSSPSSGRFYFLAKNFGMDTTSPEQVENFNDPWEAFPPVCCMKISPRNEGFGFFSQQSLRISQTFWITPWETPNSDVPTQKKKKKVQGGFCSLTLTAWRISVNIGIYRNSWSWDLKKSLQGKGLI